MNAHLAEAALDERRATRTDARCAVAWCVAFAIPLLVLAGFVADTFFLTDDAFISFRYARNLVDGHGLVFNRGEHVEGYTNLLWTLEIAGLWSLGIRPEISAHVLSLGATLGTLGAVVWSARTLLPAADRRPATWLALCLVACCPSFAVWATGGLETRQFTLLVVVGCVLMMRRHDSVAAMLLASVVFAAAELTRPEGLLLFCCAFAWLIFAVRLSGWRTQPVLAFALPFTCIVAAQFVWRYQYYGEWLPNTYYAKHVRAWYESGFDYLATATIELGAWLWLPLAFATAAVRAARRDVTLLLPFALVVPHAGYLLTIGGDHFEYRPLDFHLSLLAVPAAACVIHVARVVAGLLPPDLVERLRIRPTAVIFAGVLVCTYSHVVGVSSQLAAQHLTTRDESRDLRVVLDEHNAAALHRLPGGAALAAVVNHLRGRLRQAVAAPAREHIVFGRTRVADYAVCEALPRGVISPSAVTAMPCVGVLPFYLPDLTVIDTLGLTDRTVAHNPVAHSNSARTMAHDRHPPPGYLDERGLNLRVMQVEPSAEAALSVAEYALELRPDAWLPIEALDLAGVQDSLAEERLAWRFFVDMTEATRNRVLAGGHEYAGERLLTTFEDAGDALAWELTGAAARETGREARRLGLGEGVLVVGRGRPGTARSAAFVAERDDALVVFVSGQRAPGQRARLLADGVATETLLPRSGVRSRLAPVVVPLRSHAGRQLAIEVRCAAGGWIAVDHVMLAKRIESVRGARSAAWRPVELPEASVIHDLVTIDPLPLRNGKATHGETVVTVTNPFPAAIAPGLSLVCGPSEATIVTGPWQVNGAEVAEIGPGQTARARLEFHPAEEVRVDLEAFLVRLVVARQQVALDLRQLDLELRWQDER